MIRFILTVAIASITTFAWILFNPYNTARLTLQKTALLEKLQKNHDIYPVVPSNLSETEPTAETAPSPHQPARE